MHPWVGAGPEDQRHILSELGLESIDELFASIPAEVCVDGLELPPARDEDWIRRTFGEMASTNLAMDSAPCFLGAGVYRHLQPSIVDAVLSRAEFFTSYTPYQPEISQGTLQVIFEFQTLISRLTGLDVANASLYDGATSLVEAVLFSHRVMRAKRDLVVIAENPLENLRSSDRIRYTMLNGRLYDASTMAEVGRPESAPEYFWRGLEAGLPHQASNAGCAGCAPSRP